MLYRGATVATGLLLTCAVALGCDTSGRARGSASGLQGEAAKTADPGVARSAPSAPAPASEPAKVAVGSPGASSGTEPPSPVVPPVVPPAGPPANCGEACPAPPSASWQPLSPCTAPTDFRGLQFAVLWQWTAPANIDLGLPLVARLTDDNGDGRIDLQDAPDVLVNGYLGNDAVVLGGRTGAERFRVAAGAGYGVPSALGDIDADGEVDIVVEDQGLVVAYNHDGSLKWRADATPDNGRDLGALTLADLDHDGAVEILSDAELFDNRGHHLLSLTPARTNAAPLAVDLDGDGDLEVIFAGGAYRRDGSVYYQSASANAFAQVADLDRDGVPEVILVGEAELIVLEHDGRERKRVALIGEQQAQLTGPGLIVDVDGDGVPDIGIAGHDHYQLFAADLSLRWSVPISYGAFVYGSTAFDFDGNGTQEILYGDKDALRVFDGATGTTLATWPLPTGAAMGYPVVADVNNDGSADIVLATGQRDGMPAHVYALGAAQGHFAPAPGVWNQYNYFVSNVSPDGTIPRVQPPSWKLTNSFREQVQIDASGHACLPARPKNAL
jgi:hypothetical protein